MYVRARNIMYSTGFAPTTGTTARWQWQWRRRRALADPCRAVPCRLTPTDEQVRRSEQDVNCINRSIFNAQVGRHHRRQLRKQKMTDAVGMPNEKVIERPGTGEDSSVHTHATSVTATESPRASVRVATRSRARELVELGQYDNGSLDREVS